MPRPNWLRRRLEFSGERKWRRQKIRFVRNRFIVRLRQTGKTESEIESDIRSMVPSGVSVDNVYFIPMRAQRGRRGAGPVAVVDILPPQDRRDPDSRLLDLVDDLKNDGRVAFIEPDLRMERAVLPADPGLTNDPNAQWGWIHIGMPALWDGYLGSDEVAIAIVDGMHYEHADIAFNRAVVTENLTPSGDVVTLDLNLQDETSHATAITGLVAARRGNGIGVTGLNPTSPLYLYRTVQEHDHSTSASNIVDAVADLLADPLAVDKKIVINVSFVANIVPVDGGPPDANPDYNLLNGMCEDVRDSDRAILCCATGNAGMETLWPAAFSTDYPDTVIAVGATAISDPIRDDYDGVIHTWWKWNESVEGIWSGSATDKRVTVVAPGAELAVLRSTSPGEYGAAGNNDDRSKTGSLTGTSMATAFVTGLVSLMWSHRSMLSPAQIIQAIKETAVLPLSISTLIMPAPRWGYGRIDVAAAMRVSWPWEIPIIAVAFGSADREKLDLIAKLMEEWLHIFGPRFGDTFIGPDGTPLKAEAIESLAVLPGTGNAMEDALEVARRSLLDNEEKGFRRAIVVLTDVENPAELPEELLARFDDDAIQIHCLRLGADSVPEALATASRRTGGIAEALDPAQATTFSALRNRFAVSSTGMRLLCDEVVKFDGARSELYLETDSEVTVVDLVVTPPPGCVMKVSLAADDDSVQMGYECAGVSARRVMLDSGKNRVWRLALELDADTFAAYETEYGAGSVVAGVLVVETGAPERETTIS